MRVRWAGVKYICDFLFCIYLEKDPRRISTVKMTMEEDDTSTLPISPTVSVPLQKARRQRVWLRMWRKVHC